MARVLVIGSTGLLGSHLMELGRQLGHSMYGTFNKHTINGQDLFPLDVTKRNSVFSLLEKMKPDCVIDTHALHDVDYCETHPEEAWLINVEGTRNVAEACKRIGAKMIYISTDYIFDGKKLKYTEKDKPNPLSYYAKTKLIAEHVIEDLDVNHIIARSSVLYGKGGFGKLNFVLWLVQKLQNKEKVTIVTDQHNNPTFVNNLAKFIFLLYQKNARGVFHITGPECLSRYEFSKIIAKVFRLDASLISSITTPELKQIAKRPGKVDMLTNKLERVTGKKPMSTIEGLTMLKKQIEVAKK